MNKIKIREGIHQYRFLIIIGALAIVICFIYVVLENKKELEMYESGRDSSEYEYELYQYEANEYKPINASKGELIIDYYKDFLYKMINDRESAWQMLTKDNKQKKFNNSYEEFDKYLNEILTKFSSTNSIVKMKAKNHNNKNEFIIIDSEENYIIFYDDGIWNVEVELKGKIDLDYELE